MGGATRRSSRLFVGVASAALALTPAAVLAQSGGAATTAPHAASVRATSSWNIDKKTSLAIQGYDPVAYFPEGGGKAMKGDAAISTTYQGVTYRFANAANRDTFLENPARYEPAHGGWCSWAMKDGDKVDVDPKTFIVQDNRLFLFYNGLLGNTRAKWLKGDHAQEATQADAKWKGLSGEEPRTGEAPTAKQESLRTQLDALKAKFASAAPAETLAVYEQGIQDVAKSGVMDSVLAVGAKAPDFTLPDATGASTQLSTMLAKGPVVMVWYRGAWCPYCNLELAAYQKMANDFRDAGATLVAISPMTPDNSMSLSEKQHLAFTVLSDEKLRVAEQYGLAYTLPEKVSSSFKGKLDLAKFNGDDSNRLPITATFVVDRDGTIRNVWANADYRERAEPSEVLQAVKAIEKR